MIYGYIFNKVNPTDQETSTLPLNIPSARKQIKVIKEKYNQTYLLTTTAYLSDIDLPAKIKARDTIVIYSVTTLGKTFDEALACYNNLINNKIDVESISEPYANSSYVREAFKKAKQEMQASGQTQKIQTAGLSYYLQEMIKIAYKTATTKRTPGPKAKDNQGDSKRAKQIKSQILKYSKHFNHGSTLNNNEVIRLIGVAKNTFYKYKKQLEAET